MPKLKPVPAEKLIKVILKLGFRKARQKGSHISFEHEDGRTIVIPFHKNKPVKVGLLNQMIKRELKISREEFFKML
ncbi:MAG: type II toxin-antitoxin system HicA family toxin [Candidatus Diapherotrites archaeon]|uniref:Type II toxin-antitoxin system HicA family toxin n=1 Tax=Candidatus Iainarchaeum sp. TaxID=3101447 RepID=A0A938YTL5_9ARCH|nr:type II toxin-antitoxin system HicA family toxin [Candidatus Diapherotrites archaeon]